MALDSYGAQRQCFRPITSGLLETHIQVALFLSADMIHNDIIFAMRIEISSFASCQCHFHFETLCCVHIFTDARAKFMGVKTQTNNAVNYFNKFD